MKYCWHALYSRAFSFERLGSYPYNCRAEARTVAYGEPHAKI